VTSPNEIAVLDSNGWHAETERIGLRTFDARDLTLFLEYRNDEEIARLQGWETPYTVDEAYEFFEDLANIPPGTPGEWHQFAIVDKATGATVGDVGLHVRAADPSTADVGYTIARRYQRQGYASEAVATIIEYAFDVVGVRTIFANALAENDASRGVAERVGMALDKQWLTNNGTELVRYSIVN
jgi:RimJ/RimL family protein N-acetyltransferase